MLSGVFAFSWSKWSASPALGRRQFVMRAAEWGDEGGAGTEREVRGAYDGEGGVIWTDQELDERRGGRGSQSLRWFQPIILIVCVGMRGKGGEVRG